MRCPRGDLGGDPCSLLEGSEEGSEESPALQFVQETIRILLLQVVEKGEEVEVFTQGS